MCRTSYGDAAAAVMPPPLLGCRHCCRCRRMTLLWCRCQHYRCRCYDAVATMMMLPLFCRCRRMPSLWCSCDAAATASAADIICRCCCRCHAAASGAVAMLIPPLTPLPWYRRRRYLYHSPLLSMPWGRMPRLMLLPWYRRCRCRYRCHDTIGY